MGTHGLEPGVLVVDEHILIVFNLPGLPPLRNLHSHLQFLIDIFNSFEVVFHNIRFVLVYFYIMCT
jgi:hypothetical protein